MKIKFVVLRQAEILKVYNLLVKMGLGGKRLDKAMELVLNNALDNDYATTATSCECPDHEYRRLPCKHMLAIWLVNGAS